MDGRGFGGTRSRGVRRLVALGLAATLTLAMPADAMAATFRVKAVKGNVWRPKHTYIGKGDRVVWRNRDAKRHDLTAFGKGWRKSVTLDPGERTGFRFGKTGTFTYRCVRHSAMVGKKCKGMCGFVHVFTK